MSDLPSLIYDLALILISAGLITLLFKWLKQPLVLGYIVAGIIAGPYLDLLPMTVVDTANIQTWADIGVIFLLFALGLEFSFKRLVSVGKTAFVTASVAVIGMMLLGFLVGRMLGWTPINCLFLGGMLSMSSTTIIIKAFNDLNLMDQPYTKLVFGVLVVEDLVAVILMVLLSTISVSKELNGTELLLSIGRLVFFLALWFIFGIFLIPTFLKKARNLMNEETLLIFSIGLCLGMVIIAVKTGFSAALGAFIMGSVLSETIDAKRIEKLVEPLKNFFGAIFFVSVGMMVQPAIIVEYARPVGLLILTVIIGQTVFTTIGFLISGQTLETSLKSGFSLAQIGEFAFIIASLGISLGVTESFLYPVVIAVSVCTIFTTPYIMKLADPTYRFLSKHLPQKWIQKLDHPREKKDVSTDRNAWHVLLRGSLMYMLVLLTVVIAIYFLSTGYIYPFLQQHLSGMAASVLTFFVTVLALAPFLRAMMSNNVESSAVLNLWMEKPSNRKFLLMLVGVRFFAVLITLLVLTNKFFQIPFYINVIFTIIIFLFILKSKWLLRRFWKLESHFLINLNEQQMESNLRKIEANKGVMQLSDMAKNHWLDFKLYTCAYRLKNDCPFIGKRISELHIRSEYNLMIIRIRTRDNDYMNIPSGDYLIQEGDSLRLAGKKSQLRRLQEDELLTMEFVNHSFMTLHGFSKLEYARKKKEERITCAGIPLSKQSPLAGKNLIESNIGAKTKCLIIGLERDGKQIVNPGASTIIEAGDVVWLIGEEKPVSRHIEENVYFI
ncbi:MAG: cation:proton antiporter [Bacteroidota bacterium]|nr:cation:proton antiporter [Bacteroidota bacterium]